MQLLADAPHPSLLELSRTLSEWKAYADELQLLAEEQLRLLLTPDFEGDLSSLLEMKECLYRAIQPLSDRIGVLMEGIASWPHPEDPAWIAGKREADRLKDDLLAQVEALMAMESRSEEALKRHLSRVQDELGRMDRRKNLTQTYGSRASQSPCFLDYRR